MKILIIQDYLRNGGTERQSVLLANAFAAAGHTVTLLTFRPGGPLADTTDDRVARHALQPFDLRLDWFAPGLARFAAQANPDIVLCMGRMANCYAGRLQTHVHDSAVVATMRTGKKLPALFRQSLHQCRHIAANSRDAMQSLVRDHAVPEEKITIIHNSLVFPATSPAALAAIDLRQRLRAQHDAGPDTTVLLSVAMFRPEKNQRELIEIVADLPTDKKWQLWLAGDGPARATCERLAAARGLGRRVKFLGLQRDPSPFYHAADIAVHASWSEALSNFLIEAQAHGLPFVAYEAPGIAECCIPELTGWPIARNDRAAFQAALVRQMNQPGALHAATAALARDFARESFDPSRQVAAYLDLFACLL